MVIGIFGESCTGKSAIAEALKKKTDVKIYTGKDYLKLAKNEEEARRRFIELLTFYESIADTVIYVISEKEHLQLLPEKATRVLLTADLNAIKERFSKRMNGQLPAHVAKMLEKKHGSFDNIRHDLRIDTTDSDVSVICDEIIKL